MKLPPLTAVIEKDEDWFVATCPELGVASQGHSIEEAEAMIKEAVELLLEEASPEEIQRRLNRGVKVTPLELSHAWAEGAFGWRGLPYPPAERVLPGAAIGQPHRHEEAVAGG